MVAPSDFFLRYNCNGGRPPPTIETLTVYHNGKAQYITGHSWPTQPPFDEIGIYQNQLDQQEWDTLKAHTKSVAEIKPRTFDKPRPDDCIEYVSLKRDSTSWETSWGASQPPPLMLPLLSQIRQHISNLRKWPLSATKANLEVSAMENDTHIKLVLSNRGTIPFPISGLSTADIERQPQLRVYFHEVRGGTLKSRTPIELLALRPLLIENLRYSTDTVEINPGKPLVFLARQRLGSILQSKELRAEGLLRILWRAEGLEYNIPLQEGWVIPQPVTITATPGHRLTPMD